MQTSEAATKKLPPYLSYRTFQTFLEGLKVGTPRRVDRSVLSSLSGANQSWLLGALRFLGLTTDDGIPTEKLKALAKAQGAERQKLLQDLARAAYPSLFLDDFLHGASSKQLDEAISKMGPSGDTVRRAVTFFLGLVKEAGLQISPHIKRATRASRAPLKRRRSTNGPTSAAVNVDDTVSVSGDVQTTGRAPSWVELLASKFPTFDPTWSDDVKTKWFDGFKQLMEQEKEKI